MCAIRAPHLSMLSAIGGGATQHNDTAQEGERADRQPGQEARAPRGHRLCPARSTRLGQRAQEAVGIRAGDPYFRFWFRYVARNRSRLERGRVDEVLGEVLADFDNLMGRTFEECCRAWVGRHAPRTRWAPEQIGSWWSRDGQVEIDVVGVRRHRCVLLGSCKWRRDGRYRRARRPLRSARGARGKGRASAAGGVRARALQRGARGARRGRERDAGQCRAAVRVSGSAVLVGDGSARRSKLRQVPGCPSDSLSMGPEAAATDRRASHPTLPRAVVCDRLHRLH